MEYKTAAVLNDMICPAVGKIPEGYVVSLRGADGKIFANLWFGGEE